METIYYSLDAKRLTVCGEAAGRRASGGQETVCYAFVPRPRRPAGGLHRPGQVLGLDDLRAAAAALRLLHCLPDGRSKL